MEPFLCAEPAEEPTPRPGGRIWRRRRHRGQPVPTRATRDENLQTRRTPQQSLGELRALIEERLAGVQHEQQVLAGEELSEHLDHRPHGLALHVQRGRDREGELPGVLEARRPVVGAVVPWVRASAWSGPSG